MGADFIARPHDGRCPGCSVPIGWVGRSFCPGCEISMTGPVVAELCWVNAEMARLDHARGRLVVRRDFLLAELKRLAERGSSGVGAGAGTGAQSVPASGGAPAPAGPGHADAGVAAAGSVTVPVRPSTSMIMPIFRRQSLRSRHDHDRGAARGTGPADPRPAARAEMSRRSVANLLLAVGGLLIVIAAAAFTAANWGNIGPAGRGVILLAVAIAALAAPWPLYRRGLTATAEAFAGIGLALTVADTYLVRNIVAGPAGVGLGFAAAACAVLAAAWAAYGSVAPARGPRLAAIALAQLPLPLAVAANTHAVGTRSLAVLATAGGDLFLAAWAGRNQARIERQTARTAAAMCWLAGIGLASIGSALSPGVGASLWLSAAFLAAAAVGLLLCAERAEPATPVPAARTAAPLALSVSGALIAVGVALPAAAALPGRWAAGVFAIAGAFVAATSRWWARRSPALTDPASAGEPTAAQTAAHRQVAAGGLAVLGSAGLWVAPAAIVALLAPFANLGLAWASNPAVGLAERLSAVIWDGSAVTPIVPAVLLLLSVAFWPWRAPGRPAAKPAALAVAALAGGSIPVAAGLPDWAALVVLTALAALLAGSGTVMTDRTSAATASWAGVALAACAVVSSLTAPGSTIAELAVLAVMFGAAAWSAKSTLPTVLTTASAVAVSAGLACAVTLAVDSGSASGAEQIAAFGVLGVAMAAIAAATLLQRVRPCHALVLDQAALVVVVLATALAARQGDTFSLLASAAALLAATTTWLRAGRRRFMALGVAALATVAAIVPQLTVLVGAATRPYYQLARPWSGLRAGQEAATNLAGLQFAMTILAVCGATAIVGAGAWRGSWGSRSALAAVLPVAAAPAGATAGLSSGATLALMLALTLTLTAWAAASRSLAPAGAALTATWLTLPWALSTRPGTLTAVGCLSVAYSLCAWRARLTSVRVGAAAAAVVAAGALAGTAALAAGRPGWQAGLTMLAVAGGAQLVAAALVGVRPVASLRLFAGPNSGARASTDAGVGPATDARVGPATDASAGPATVPGSDVGVGLAGLNPRSMAGLAIEMAGWLVVILGVLPGLREPVPASIALALAGALCVGVAVRPDRRSLLWAGLALGEAALCVRLAAAGVRAPEPYTLPASVILIAFGWHRSRRSPEADSWLTYGPGLAVLLLPSLLAAWSDDGWLRPLLLGLAATGVTLAGGRARLRAPLLMGAAVAVADAGRQLAPAIARLAGLLPRWVPVALLGLILLSVGATYEARLKDLGKVRDVLRRMR